MIGLRSGRRAWRFAPDLFLLAMLAAIALAALAPARGPAASGVAALANGAIVLLFFLHGARLSRPALIAGLSHWRLHLAILACTYALAPALTLAAAAAAPGLLPPELWLGVMFLGVLPSTVQSSIALTALGGGNVSAAVAAAAASNLIGVFATPFAVGLIVHAQAASGSLGAVGDVALRLLAPFFAGHLARPLIADWVDRRKRLLTFTDRGAIVLVVYAAFSAAVVAGVWERLAPGVLATLASVCAGLLGLMLAIVWIGSKALGFGRADRVAILNCGVQKSLASGAPMAGILFAAPAAGLAILPVMLYHQMQLALFAWLAPRLAVRG